MDLETFQKVSSQLINGKMSHLEFLSVLKKCGEAFEPHDKETECEKKEMMALLENIIERARNAEDEEKMSLARDVETWLSRPEIQS